VVLDVHGGPNAAFPPTPWIEMVTLADAGIAVVYANPRGSSSYGRAFTSATEGGWGAIDASDQFLALEWAVAEGLADPERQGVMGLSYGGFMTNWLLGHHPGRFKAGVSENPVTDLVGMFATSDIGTSIDDAQMLRGVATPWRGLDAMVAASPFVHVHRSQAPLLLLVCEEDRRCPPSQSELVFAIGTSLGRRVEMVRYPGESHMMFVGGRPDRRVDRLDRIVDWFGRHL
jgi:dipeptidyl aminopeptidase/acylaminoacyl peptidase